MHWNDLSPCSIVFWSKGPKPWLKLEVELLFLRRLNKKFWKARSLQLDQDLEQMYVRLSCISKLIRVIISCCLCKLQRGDLVPLAVKVGDNVLLPEYGGTKVEIEDKEYHLFRESDLLAKIEQ